ncbi:MAG: glutamine synthetase beta-grasp domain-containing protein [Patescibacteria group bacterium]
MNNILKIMATYIWLDGAKVQKLRSKVKIIGAVKSLCDIPPWSFDGSSTYQATGNKSDLALLPVYYLPDPILGSPNILVMCEVYNTDGKPHSSNHRNKLQQAVKKYPQAKAWFGYEQEFTMYDKRGKWPLGWPVEGYPGAQGPYYCGVGANDVNGRELVDLHTIACMRAGIKICGTNAEVMPSQWEFQIGPLGALEVSDQIWLARWLLYRLGEDLDISPKLDPKPFPEEDWNGAGCHINFSTAAMRRKGGINAIYEAIRKLEGFHKQHIQVYGDGNEERLTGKHETCDINTFKAGIGDRGASIRIPLPTVQNNRGYLEDRRPAANVNPYLGCLALLETVCGNGFKP